MRSERLSAEEESAVTDVIVRSFAKAFAVSGCCAALGSIALARSPRTTQWYQGLTRSVRVGILFAAPASCGTIHGFTTFMAHERDHSQTAAHQVTHGIVPANRAGDASSLQDFVATNRFPLLGGLWIAAMAGALTWSFSGGRAKRYTVMQNLIHARVGAQAITIGALLTMAAIVPGEDHAAANRVSNNAWEAQLAKMEGQAAQQNRARNTARPGANE